MAVRAINLTTELTYVSDDDPGKGTPEETSFTLSPLTSTQSAMVNDLLASFSAADAQAGEAGAMSLHQAAVLAVRLALTGWSNFLDHDDKEVEFKTSRQTMGKRVFNMVTPDLLDRIPMGDIFGMYRMLMEAATPNEAQRKNS